MKKIANPQLLLIAVLSFSLLGFLGCESTETVTPENLEIFPLKVGNKWNFLSVRNDNTKTIHVNEVTKDTMVAGETWFVLTYDASISTICKNNSKGWWFLYSPLPASAGVPSLYYRYPATVNEQYMTADSTLVTVVSTNEMVTVEAGTFYCYQYHMVHYLESYQCREYFAPGVGFIKHVVYEPNSGMSKVYETTTLTSCYLNSK